MRQRWTMGGSAMMASILTGVLAMTGPDLAEAQQPSSVETYEVDPVHTSVTFKIEHLGVAWVFGRFNEIEGGFTLGDDEVEMAFTVPAASIDTNHQERDDHLRSDDFFDVQTYPEIRFESTQVRETGSNEYELTGDLTLLGETKEVTVDLEQTGEGEGMQGEYRVGWYTEFSISRSEFGMDAFQGLVGDEVVMMISIQGIRQ